MRRIPVKATMDSDAWRPFDPVDVKRRVAPGCGAATTGRLSSSRRPDKDGGYTWRDVSVVTFITLLIDAGA
jgi:hypothetical protein